MPRPIPGSGCGEPLAELLCPGVKFWGWGFFSVLFSNLNGSAAPPLYNLLLFQFKQRQQNSSHAGRRRTLLFTTRPHAWLAGSELGQGPGPGCGPGLHPPRAASPGTPGGEEQCPDGFSGAGLGGYCGMGLRGTGIRWVHAPEVTDHVTTSSTTSRQGSSVELVNLPCPAGTWRGRGGSAATPGEKVALGKTPSSHTAYVKERAVACYSCNLLHEIHSPICISTG